MPVQRYLSSLHERLHHFDDLVVGVRLAIDNRIRISLISPLVSLQLLVILDDLRNRGKGFVRGHTGIMTCSGVPVSRVPLQ